MYLNDRNIKVKNVTTSHVDAKYKFFKVVILRDDLKHVLNKDFWPEGVKFRIWKKKILSNHHNNIRSRAYYNSASKGSFNQ